MEKKQPMQNRAYSVLQVKGLDEETRVITGIATTPSPDRVGDIVEPKGIKFNNPMPFLWQHDHKSPIGTVIFKPASEKGIEFEATIATIAEEGVLKNRVDEAWQSIKAGLVRAVSIGFRPMAYEPIEKGGYRFTESEVYELSAVTIPANADAIISTIKSLDAEIRAEAGIEAIPADDKPAATGKGRVVKLDAPARDGAKPFVIRNIKR